MRPARAPSRCPSRCCGNVRKVGSRRTVQVAHRHAQLLCDARRVEARVTAAHRRMMSRTTLAAAPHKHRVPSPAPARPRERPARVRSNSPIEMRGDDQNVARAATGYEIELHVQHEALPSVGSLGRWRLAVSGGQWRGEDKLCCVHRTIHHRLKISPARPNAATWRASRYQPFGRAFAAEVSEKAWYSALKMRCILRGNCAKQIPSMTSTNPDTMFER